MIHGMDARNEDRLHAPPRISCLRALEIIVRRRPAKGGGGYPSACPCDERAGSIRRECLDHMSCSAGGRIVPRPILAGLHHHYVRA